MVPVIRLLLRSEKISLLPETNSCFSAVPKNFTLMPPRQSMGSRRIKDEPDEIAETDRLGSGPVDVRSTGIGVFPGETESGPTHLPRLDQAGGSAE